jgi:hypothetical protein
MRSAYLALLIAAPFAACSVINSFDDVNADGDASTGSGGAGSGGGANGGVGADAGDDGTVPPPTKGLMVVGGTGTDPLVGVLTVLDAVDGSELVERELLTGGADIAGVAYDGADGRDAWFIFFAADFPAKSDKTANLEVRRYDEVANEWKLLSRVTALPPPRPNSFAVLNDRLAYLSHKVEAGVPVQSLTVLDTTDLFAVTEVDFSAASLVGADMIALLGSRGAAENPASLGGTLNVFKQQNCSRINECELLVQTITVGDSIVEGLSQNAGNFQGLPAFATQKTTRLDFGALPKLDVTQNTRLAVEVVRAEPQAWEAATPFTATSSAEEIGGLTIDECQNVALFTSNEERNLYGVTRTGIGSRQELGYPGQQARWEPYTGNVITTFNPAFEPPEDLDAGMGMTLTQPAISAFSVTSNETGTSLTIAPLDAASWNPPADLVPNTFELRFPLPHSCP